MCRKLAPKFPMSSVGAACSEPGSSKSDDLDPSTENVEEPRTPILLQTGFPAFAEIRLQAGIGFRVVGDDAFFSVVEQFAFVMDGDGAEEKPFGVASRDVEVRAGWCAALAGPDPVAAVGGMIVSG